MTDSAPAPTHRTAARQAAGEPGDASLDHIHVVLVEPGDPLNVGAVARAMSNLGFRHLHLVAPPRYDAKRAATTACWATDLLAQAREHATLQAALAPMQEVVGFTARHGRHRPQHVTLPQWSQGMRRTLAVGPAVATALLFGPEDTGLRTEHLPPCRWLVNIPSRAENPSFNLAQAVLLALFELSRPEDALDALDAPEGSDAGERPPRPAPTTSVPPLGERVRAREGDLQQLERLVEEASIRSGFYGKGTPAPLPDLVKHLLRRIEPDTRELPVLLGLFDRINRTLSGRSPVQPLPSGAPTGDSDE